MKSVRFVTISRNNERKVIPIKVKSSSPVKVRHGKGASYLVAYSRPTGAFGVTPVQQLLANKAAFVAAHPSIPPSTPAPATHPIPFNRGMQMQQGIQNQDYQASIHPYAPPPIVHNDVNPSSMQKVSTPPTVTGAPSTPSTPGPSTDYSMKNPFTANSLWGGLTDLGVDVQNLFAGSATGYANLAGNLQTWANGQSNPVARVAGTVGAGVTYLPAGLMQSFGTITGKYGSVPMNFATAGGFALGLLLQGEVGGVAYDAIKPELGLVGSTLFGAGVFGASNAALAAAQGQTTPGIIESGLIGAGAGALGEVGASLLNKYAPNALRSSRLFTAKPDNVLASYAANPSDVAKAAADAAAEATTRSLVDQYLETPESIRLSRDAYNYRNYVDLPFTGPGTPGSPYGDVSLVKPTSHEPAYWGKTAAASPERDIELGDWGKRFLNFIENPDLGNPISLTAPQQAANTISHETLHGVTADIIRGSRENTGESRLYIEQLADFWDVGNHGPASSPELINLPKTFTRNLLDRSLLDRSLTKAASSVAEAIHIPMYENWLGETPRELEFAMYGYEPGGILETARVLAYPGAYPTMATLGADAAAKNTETYMPPPPD